MEKEGNSIGHEGNPPAFVGKFFNFIYQDLIEKHFLIYLDHVL